MTRWSLRTRMTVAVTVTVAVAFLAGAALLALLAAVEDQGPSSERVIERLESDRLGERGAIQTLARRRVAVAGIVATAVAAATGWVLVGRALRPLARLQESAAEVAVTTDVSRRVPIGSGPEEIDVVARTLNQMLERLQVAEASLRSALDASRSFAAGAAHELRTPLTSLQADLEVLDDPRLKAEQRDEVLAEMRAEQGRLVALLDQLLALSRGDLAAGGDDELVDLGDLVEVAVQTTRRRSPTATITVSVEGECSIIGSPEGLRLAIDNLLENAVRHGGGQVAVAAAPEPAGEGVVIRVDDAGPGIPVGDRDRVLGRFERGSGVTAPGSGLGLALVDQQARRHGGHLELDDSPSGGLRIELHLPPAGRPGAGA